MINRRRLIAAVVSVIVLAMLAFVIDNVVRSGMRTRQEADELRMRAVAFSAGMVVAEVDLRALRDSQKDAERRALVDLRLIDESRATHRLSWGRIADGFRTCFNATGRDCRYVPMGSMSRFGFFGFQQRTSLMTGTTTKTFFYAAAFREPTAAGALLASRGLLLCEPSPRAFHEALPWKAGRACFGHFDVVDGSSHTERTVLDPVRIGILRARD